MEKQKKKNENSLPKVEKTLRVLFGTFCLESKDYNQNNAVDTKNNTITAKLKDFFDRKVLKALLMVILGSIIYSLAVVWFYDLGGFFAGGVTGISQLFARIVGEFTHKSYSVGLLVFFINLPLFMFGSRSVSKKFALLSFTSIITQSITIYILEKTGISPLKSVIDATISLDLTKYVKEEALKEGVNTIILTYKNTGGRLLLAVIGGGIAGYGSAICLKFGGSTGGMDIISNSLLVKRGISFTKISFLVDAIIIVSSGYFGIETALYTLVRLVVTTLTIDHYYTIYKTVKLEIITDKAEEIRALLLTKFHHGMTIYDVKGGYTLQSKKAIEVVVSSYEVIDYTSAIDKIDKNAFISVTGLNNIKGNYKKRTIV